MIRFSVTILLSAFLLFQVQPLIARFVLPWFGGTPAVWTTCMLFFQVLLLFGYAYSHFMASRVNPKTAAIVHIGLLLLALAFLPIIPEDNLKPDGSRSPVLQILMLLSVTIGLPYIMLSTTGPLMQAWFARTFPTRSPYRLFALSNFGSLVALLSYPFVFEPRLRLNHQATLWAWAFLTFVACCCWCAFSTAYLLRENRKTDGNSKSKRVPDKKAAATEAEEGNQLRKPRLKDMLLWVLLSAVPSVLLLASTSQICQEIAVVAFLWVLPLSLYLLSFIICFDNPFWYRRVFFGISLVVCIAVATYCLSIVHQANLYLQLFAFSGALFAACMTCHGELAASKPRAQSLTLFYLMVSIGGALGGFFVVVIAPMIFHDYWELHTAFVAALLLTGIGFVRNGHWKSLRLVLQGIVVGGLLFFSVMYLIAPERFSLKNGYLLMFVATIVFAVQFVLFGVGHSSSIASKPPDKTSGIEKSAIVKLIIANISIGLVLAFGLRYVLLSYARTTEGRMLPLIIVAAAAGARYLLGKKKPNLLANSLYRRASDMVHAFAAICLVVGFSIALWRQASMLDKITVDIERDFFGVLRVWEYSGADLVLEDHDGNGPRSRKLVHGKTVHGQQFIEPDLRRYPTCYYLKSTGVGIALNHHPARQQNEQSLNIGAVGLGVGTVATYGRPGDKVKFYEIDPQVEKFAREHFYFLDESQADVSVVIGDARIEMDRELNESGSEEYDVLIIDAFSSDAIPRHLLTAESLELYLQHLKPDGILAFHISNLHLELEPVVYTLARRKGLIPGFIKYDPTDAEKQNQLALFSSWAILTRNEEFLKDAEVRKRRGNSDFVLNAIKAMPEYEAALGAESKFVQMTLYKENGVSAGTSIDIRGTKANGKVVIPGTHRPNEPDATLFVGGKQIPLFMELDDRFYWTDDFGSLWEVAK